MKRSASVETSGSPSPRTWTREAPAIRPFAEPDPSLVHWSELDRMAKTRTELMNRDVRSYFVRFG